jgi:uncharacterized membrane protein SpoIIM required for sporulation
MFEMILSALKLPYVLQCRLQKEESLIFRVTKTTEVSTAEKVTLLVITTIITGTFVQWIVSMSQAKVIVRPDEQSSQISFKVPTRIF